jgi:hypothetical protein
MLRHTFAFSTDILPETFMYMSRSSDSYKYMTTTSINCKDICFCVIKDIRYHKVIPFITREYVSLKSISSLCVNPYTTSLTLYLTTSLFSFHFQMKTHLNPIGWILRGVGITLLNTSLFLIESISASVASFHLIQSERCLHSTMVL